MKKLDDSYTQALLEEVVSQNKALLEGQKELLKLPEKVDKMDDRLKSVEGDVKVIKSAVTLTDKELKSPERRVTHLEAA